MAPLVLAFCAELVALGHLAHAHTIDERSGGRYLGMRADVMLAAAAALYDGVALLATIICLRLSATHEQNDAPENVELHHVRPRNRQYGMLFYA